MLSLESNYYCIWIINKANNIYKGHFFFQETKMNNQNQIFAKNEYLLCYKYVFHFISVILPHHGKKWFSQYFFILLLSQKTTKTHIYVIKISDTLEKLNYIFYFVKKYCIKATEFTYLLQNILYNYKVIITIYKYRLKTIIALELVLICS